MLDPRAHPIDAGRVHDHLSRLASASGEELRIYARIEQMCNSVGFDDAARIGVEVLVGGGAVRKGYPVVFIRREVLGGVEIPRRSGLRWISAVIQEKEIHAVVFPEWNDVRHPAVLPP